MENESCAAQSKEKSDEHRHDRHDEVKALNVVQMGGGGILFTEDDLRSRSTPDRSAIASAQDLSAAFPIGEMHGWAEGHAADDKADPTEKHSSPRNLCI